MKFDHFSPVPELGGIDCIILEELQKNARTSFKQLSALTGVAPSTCLERVRNLRRSGVVSAFRADLDLARLGRPVEALIAIRFHTHSRDQLDPFVEYVFALPETIGLFNLTGEDDFIVHVAVADVDHLRTFVLDRLGSRAEIDHLRTALVYEHFRKHVIKLR